MDPRLKESYVDKAGTVWYEFTHDGLMCWKRFMSAQLAERFLRHGLTDTFLDKIIETGTAIAFDQARTPAQLREDMVAIFSNLKMRKGYVSSEDQYLRLASVYFMLPDEPIDECYDSWTEKKIQMWNADSEAKDFFLQKAIIKTHALPDISIADIRTLLTVAKERAANIPTLPLV